MTSFSPSPCRGKHARPLMTRELDKDIVQLPERDLERHLRDAGAIV
jgi:hypothetical protein